MLPSKLDTGSSPPPHASDDPPSSSSSSSSSNRRASQRYYYNYENYDSPAIVDLTMVEASSGVYYTMPVTLGGTTFNLQPDTGSSDLWVAGSNCNAASCTNVQRYTPTSSSTAHDANQPFTIDYVVGSVSGEIYWEEMEIGGRLVPYQSIASASNVEDEDMYGGKFSGVIGLALPGNSLISETLDSPWALGPLSNLEIPPPPPPDGADLSAGPASWLTRRRRDEDDDSLSTGYSNSSSSKRDLSFTPYITMSLSRPSAPTIPSQIGFDTHLTNLCPQECSDNLAFTNVIESSLGVPLFWRAPVQAISVTDANGVNTTLKIGASVLAGQAWPVAVLDSGAMGIYSSNRELLNGIYGSAGIGPGADGNYYMPCTTALNITITMTIGVFPIHPLDISDLIPNDPSHKTCLGALQYVSASALSGKGDLILGAAFMRNVYTVLSGPTYTRSGTWTTPQLSLLSLTNTSTAADEFYKIRVLNQDLPATTSGAPSSATSPTTGTALAGKSRVPVIAGISVAAVVAVAGAVFLIWFLLLRRRLKQNGRGTLSPRAASPSGGTGAGAGAGGSGAYALKDASLSTTGSSAHPYGLAPDSPGTPYGHADRSSGKNTNGSIGSSTMASSYFDTEDEEKAGIASHAKRNGRQHAPSATRRQTSSSLMGEGYEDFEEDERGGLTGTYAPWQQVETPEEEQSWDMGRISTYDPHPPPPTDAVPVLAKGWRIQNEGGSRRAETQDRLSDADKLLKARRDARRNRTESPASVDRSSHASSSNWTLSSTSTVAATGSSGSSNPSVGGGQHSYPPPARSSTYSGSSGSPSSPPPSRPSLVTYASNRTPGTIVESPTASPIDAERSFQSLIPSSLPTSPSPTVAALSTPKNRRTSALPFNDNPHQPHAL